MLVPLFSLSVWLVPQLARSQAVSANLLGKITDTSGAVVVGARITATEIRTGVSTRTSANAEGLYSIPYLAPGIYRVEVGMQGFKKFISDDAELRIGAVLRVDAVLELGAVTDSVEVTAQSPLLQTDTAEVSRSFSQKSVAELPLLNRSFEGLVGLLPGVTPPSENFLNLEDPMGTTSYRANGQGSSGNNKLVDGVNNLVPGNGDTIYVPPAEVIQEVYITTSSYDAAFGRAGGAVISAVTRGGTNDLHGSLSEFHRDTHLRARNFFNIVGRPKPSFVRNQYGATIGGPIKKNRTFFFASYQGSNIRQATAQTNTVPVVGWRSGDFRGVPGLNLFDPATGSLNGTGRTAFPDNVIPASRIHRVSAKLTPLLPVPNASGLVNNFFANVPANQDSNIYDVRIDHHFSENTKLFGRFNWSKYNVLSGAALGNIGQATQSDDYTSTSALNLTHTFSSKLLTEIRLGYNRYKTHVDGLLDRPLSSELGIANPNPTVDSTRGLSSINIGGMPSLGARPQDPLNDADNLYQIVNSWTRIAGAHQMKWGVDATRYIRGRRTSAGPIFFSERGRFDFNPSVTALPGGPALGSFGAFGNSFASFLLGAADLTGRSYVSTTPTDRITPFFSFFQDTWQVTSKLTLNLGLRHEVYTPTHPQFAGGASNYDPYTNTLLIAGLGDVPLNTGVSTDWNNFAPRFGLSYRLNRTVIRTGYGISYYMGISGFSGGTLATQFPAVLHTQVGVANDYRVDGTLDSIPPIGSQPIPKNGRLTPDASQPLFAIPLNNLTPFVHSYNFTIQRAIGRNLTVDLGYVGSLGRRLPYSQELNVAPPGAGSAGLALFRAFGRTATSTLRANGVNNNYNALQANATKRFSHGLSFTVAYTFSKALGVGSGDQGSFINQLDFRKNYGPVAYDSTHMLTVSHVYELPFGTGKPFLSRSPVRFVAGGWQVNGILRSATGTPFTATADATSCNCPGNGNFADAVSPVRILGGTGPGELWFSTSSFAQPGPNRFGTAGRNTIRGPGLINYDFSVFRNFRVRERMRIEFRSEFYNLTNTPHFNSPVASFNAGNFGQVTSSYGEREIQFALRLIF
jgi:hypothetical protein